MPTCSYTRAKGSENKWNIRALYDHGEPVPSVGQTLEFEVTTKNGNSHHKAGTVFWTGTDRDTGCPLALAEQDSPADGKKGQPGTAATCPHCGQELTIWFGIKAAQKKPGNSEGQGQPKQTGRPPDSNPYAAPPHDDSDIPF